MCLKNKSTSLDIATDLYTSSRFFVQTNDVATSFSKSPRFKQKKTVVFVDSLDFFD